MSIWSLIIPLGLEVLKFILNRANVSAEVKRSFFEFARIISGEYLNSVKLRESYSAQLEELKKKMEAESGNNIK